jgi:hypothetical protein
VKQKLRQAFTEDDVTDSDARKTRGSVSMRAARSYRLLALICPVGRGRWCSGGRWRTISESATAFSHAGRPIRRPDGTLMRATSPDQISIIIQARELRRTARDATARTFAMRRENNAQRARMRAQYAESSRWHVGPVTGSSAPAPCPVPARPERRR